MKEIWKILPGTGGFYRVSSLGGFQSCKLSPRKPTTKGKWRDLRVARDGKGRGVLAFTHLGRRRGVSLSRTLYELFIGKIPDGAIVDHINRDYTDNTLSNLRLSTYSRNTANTNYIKGVSKYRGVNKHGVRWRARICILGKSISLGVYDRQEDAALAYNRAASDYFGDSVVLNKLI